MTDIRNLQAFALYMQKTDIKFDLFSVTKEMEKQVYLSLGLVDTRAPPSVTPLTIHSGFQYYSEIGRPMVVPLGWNNTDCTPGVYHLLSYPIPYAVVSGLMP